MVVGRWVAVYQKKGCMPEVHRCASQEEGWVILALLLIKELFSMENSTKNLLDQWFVSRWILEERDCKRVVKFVAMRIEALAAVTECIVDRTRRDTRAEMLEQLARRKMQQLEGRAWMEDDSK
jgi:hypothetical protein